jgi:hypothetical protein
MTSHPASYHFAFKEVKCPGRGAPACAPKERADTLVCPYGGFRSLSLEKACHLLESALVSQSGIIRSGRSCLEFFGVDRSAHECCYNKNLVSCLITDIPPPSLLSFSYSFAKWKAQLFSGARVRSLLKVRLLLMQQRAAAPISRKPPPNKAAVALRADQTALSGISANSTNSRFRTASSGTIFRSSD